MHNQVDRWYSSLRAGNNWDHDTVAKVLLIWKSAILNENWDLYWSVQSLVDLLPFEYKGPLYRVQDEYGWTRLQKRRVMQQDILKIWFSDLSERQKRRLLRDHPVFDSSECDRESVYDPEPFGLWTF